ncbi:MAG: biopolymer transporter ExbD [Pseudomonadota bacterium]
MNNRRIKRMERQHARNKKVPFNVVSLMDIFTILVFFLLVNTNEITPLPNPKGIEMPESISEVTPQESVVVMLSNEAVRLQGVDVITIDELMKEDSIQVSLFVEKLKQLANEVEPESEEDPEREVTIMGDKEVPYKVLDRVMRLCATHAGFSKISLSVIQKETQLASNIES